MRSNIISLNGIEVKVGDIIVLPYFDPSGRMDDKPSEYDERYEVIFKYGCYGYFDELHFIPLFEHQMKRNGEYISNAGNKVEYLEKYMFWVEENKSK